MKSVRVWNARTNRSVRVVCDSRCYYVYLLPLIHPRTEFSKLFRGLDGLFFGRALALSVGRCKSGSVSIPINRGLNDHALFCLEFACPNSDWALKSYRQK